MEKIIWSKSKLGCMEQCPYKYKLHYVDKIKEAEVEAMTKGVKLHKIFDNYYDLKDITKAIQKENLDQDFMDKYGDHITHFMDFNSKYKLIPIVKETKYDLDNFTGIIDRVDIIDNEYAIIDYKSSSGTSIENYMKELLLYAHLIQEGKKIVIGKVGIFFTTNNKFIVESITQSQIDFNLFEIKEEIKLYEEMINNKQFPKTYTNCHWCGYKEMCKK